MEREQMKEIIGRNREALGLFYDDNYLNDLVDINEKLWIKSAEIIYGVEPATTGLILADGLFIGCEIRL